MYLMAEVPITVTVDADLVDELKQRVDDGEATSASAFVVEALRERLRRHDLAAVVAKMVGDEPLTDEERAWADAQLDRAR